MEIISGTQTLREEFEPWLVSTGQICAELSRDYKTWPFASSEQCLVGAFLSGAARLRIPACLESNFKHVRIKDSEATYDHKYRVDLWIQLRLSSYIEFKLSVDGRDNVNLRTKVGDAKTQLLRVNPYEGGQAFSAVVFAYRSDQADPKTTPKNVRDDNHDLIARFKGSGTLRADVFFQKVW